jgi:hypothetical protein
MVVETNKKAKSKKPCKNRGITKTQLGFSLDQLTNKTTMLKYIKFPTFSKNENLFHPS